MEDWKSKLASPAAAIWSMVIPNFLASNAACANALGLCPMLVLIFADAFATDSITSFTLRDNPADWFKPSTIPVNSPAMFSKLPPANVEVLSNPCVASSLKPKKWEYSWYVFTCFSDTFIAVPATALIPIKAFLASSKLRNISLEAMFFRLFATALLPASIPKNAFPISAVYFANFWPNANNDVKDLTSKPIITTGSVNASANPLANPFIPVNATLRPLPLLAASLISLFTPSKKLLSIPILLKAPWIPFIAAPDRPNAFSIFFSFSSLSFAIFIVSFWTSNPSCISSNNLDSSSVKSFFTSSSLTSWLRRSNSNLACLTINLTSLPFNSETPFISSANFWDMFFVLFKVLMYLPCMVSPLPYSTNIALIVWVRPPTPSSNSLSWTFIFSISRVIAFKDLTPLPSPFSPKGSLFNWSLRVFNSVSAFLNSLISGIRYCYFIINIKKNYFFDALATYDGGDTVLLEGILDLFGFAKSISLFDLGLFNLFCSS